MARSAKTIAKTNRTRAAAANVKAEQARVAGLADKAAEHEAAARYFTRMAEQAEAPGFRSNA